MSCSTVDRLAGVSQYLYVLELLLISSVMSTFGHVTDGALTNADNTYTDWYSLYT